MNSNSLRHNLESYRKKKYVINAISGLWLFLGVGGALWIALSLTEYLLNLDRLPRAIMFYGFWLVVLSILFIKVIIPILNWYGINRKTDDIQAAKEVGDRLQGVEDRLLNALYLMKDPSSDGGLARASLEQRAIWLDAFDFRQAVQISEGLSWLKWSLIPWFVAVIISFADSSILLNGSSRIFNYNLNYLPEAPFSFVLDNESLVAVEGEPFDLKVSTMGRSIPENAFVVVDGVEFRMKNESDGAFAYRFEPLRSEVRFRLKAGKVLSEELSIMLHRRPKLVNMETRATYPAYTGLSSASFRNRTRVMVPEGTKLDWQVDTKDAELAFVKNSSVYLDAGHERGILSFSEVAIASHELIIGLTGAYGLLDSTQVDVVVVKDAFPQIEVDAVIDSTDLVFYFNGSIEDDYGFTRLLFVSEMSDGERFSRDLTLKSGGDKQGFTWVWSADTAINSLGEGLKVWFEVWDNDGINGPKLTRSVEWEYKAPSANELSEKQQLAFESTKATLEKEDERLKELNNDLQQIKKDLLEKKSAEWEDKQALKEMFEQRMEMLKNIQNRAEEQQNQLEQSKRFNEYSETLLEKQRMIQDMFDRLFDEDFKEKYEELNRMLDELSKERMLEELEKTALDNEKLEKELDRTLELFKELEFEMAVEESIQRIEELRKDQENLREENADKKNSNEDLAKDQNSLSERLGELDKKLQDLKDFNKALEEPNTLPDFSEEMDNTKEDMSEATEELGKDNRKKAGEKQEQAEDGLEKMSQSLSAFQDQMSQDQQSENLEDMRQILENLVELSLRQEAVMEDLKPVKGSDPKFTAYTKLQRDIMDDTKVVEDSLLALSKRAPMIDRKLNDLITEVKYNMAEALLDLSNQQPNQEQRFRAMAAEHQQLSMTALNDLALLFDAIIQDMQRQMAMSMKGTGQCKKPGDKSGTKSSASEMKRMQEALNKQLQQLKDAMDKGENPNGKKPGESAGLGMAGQSKELARMAAQQAEIRKQLREMSEALDKGSNPKAGAEMDRLAEMMEETEQDLLYDKIDAETFKRQQDILVKLLESEKADREREMEERRESKEASFEYDVPKEVWEQFIEDRETELELFQSLPPNLKPFYRNEVKRYFSIIE